MRWSENRSRPSSDVPEYQALTKDSAHNRHVHWIPDIPIIHGRSPRRTSVLHRLKLRRFRPHTLRHGNRSGDPSKSPRCGAKTSSGTPCCAPAMWNKNFQWYTRCRLHGGASTGPRTAEGLERCQKANWKHGEYSAAHKASRREIRQFVRQCRKRRLRQFARVKQMRESRPELFRGRHFRDDVIVLCVRWYLRYPLSYRNLEEMMAERGLAVDHSTIARRVLRYAPVLNQRIRSEMRHPGWS